MSGGWRCLSPQKQALRDTMDDLIRNKTAEVEAYACEHPDEPWVREMRTNAHKGSRKPRPPKLPTSRKPRA